MTRGRIQTGSGVASSRCLRDPRRLQQAGSAEEAIVMHTQATTLQIFVYAVYYTAALEKRKKGERESHIIDCGKHMWSGILLHGPSVIA